MTVELAGDRVVAARSVINHGELRHLGPIADLWALAHERAAQSRETRS